MTRPTWRDWTYRRQAEYQAAWNEARSPYGFTWESGRQLVGGKPAIQALGYYDGPGHIDVWMYGTDWRDIVG